MADAATTPARRRRRVREPDPTLNILVVLGDRTAVNDVTGELPDIDHQAYDHVFSIDPDGLLSPHSLKSVSTRPVALSVADHRQPQVKMSTSWTVELAAVPAAERVGSEMDVHAIADNAVVAIAIALNVAKRQHPHTEWEVTAVRRDCPVGAML